MSALVFYGTGCSDGGPARCSWWERRKSNSSRWGVCVCVCVCVCVRVRALDSEKWQMTPTVLSCQMPTDIYLVGPMAPSN